MVDYTANLVSEILSDCGVSVSNHTLAQLKREIRQRWGGLRIYIPKHGNDRQEDRRERDLKIARDVMNGTPIAHLALRYGLTERRIRQISTVEKSREIA